MSRTNEIKAILMERDGLTESEADSSIEEGMNWVWEELENGGDPEQAFMDHFGLETDYLLDALI